MATLILAIVIGYMVSAYLFMEVDDRWYKMPLWACLLAMPGLLLDLAVIYLVMLVVEVVEVTLDAFIPSREGLG